MIPNKRPASEYRVRTLDRNDLNEKGKIYIGKGGTTTVDGVAGVSDITAKNIITAINENATDKTIKADTLSAQNGIASIEGDIVVGGDYKDGVYLKNGSAAAVIVGPSDPHNNSGLIITKKGLYVNNPTNDANVVSIDNSGNIKAAGHISSTKHSIMVVDINGTTHLAEMDGDGNISSTNGNITAANGIITAKTFNARSDKRLKENIVEYSPNKSILDLPIYSYNFISDEKKTKKIGCLAQDLQKICPEIVHEGNDGFLSIEENKLVYLLLEEVKKLKKRVDELEAK